MAIGVLAFQGDVIEHIRALEALNVGAMEVRSPEELAKVDALIIPGGESTVIGKFLLETGLRGRIIERHRAEQFPIYGTCAGAILLAQDVLSNGMPETRVHPLRLMDITIERNAYGRQTESFEAKISLRLNEETKECQAVFIRAPKIVGVGKSVEILARHDGFPVLCRQGTLLVSVFHPELVDFLSPLHRHFLEAMKLAEMPCRRA